MAATDSSFEVQRSIGAIAQQAKGLLKTRHIDEQRSTIGTQWLFQTQIAGFGAQVTSAQPLQSMPALIVVKGSRLKSLDRVDDEVRMNHRRDVRRHRRA